MLTCVVDSGNGIITGTCPACGHGWTRLVRPLDVSHVEGRVCMFYRCLGSNQHPWFTVRGVSSGYVERSDSDPIYPLVEVFHAAGDMQW